MADTRNANNLGRVRATLDNQVNHKQLSQKHNECAPARLNIDEQAVQDIIASIKEFDCFPFNPASPTIRTMQSAIPAPAELIHDFRTTKEAGETQLKTLMDERVYLKGKCLHDRIKRNTCLTFANAPVTKATGENLKVKQGEMEIRALASVVNLVDSSGLVSLSDVLTH